MDHKEKKDVSALLRDLNDAKSENHVATQALHAQVNKVFLIGLSLNQSHWWDAICEELPKDHALFRSASELAAGDNRLNKIMRRENAQPKALSDATEELYKIKQQLAQSVATFDGTLTLLIQALSQNVQLDVLKAMLEIVPSNHFYRPAIELMLTSCERSSTM